MNLTHSLTLEQIQLLPMKSYLSRAKPQHWVSLENMLMSAHRNQPKILDTLRFKGGFYQLVHARLTSVDSVELRFKWTGGYLAPQEMIVCITANTDERGAA